MSLFEITSNWNDELLHLLENNDIGTLGKSMVYRHLHVREKLNHFQHPFFVNLKRNDKIIGTCCFLQRSPGSDGLVCFYIRYFSFKNSYRSNPSGERQIQLRGRLKQEVDSILDGQQFVPNDQNVFYAYVDPHNIRSKNLCDAYGFKEVRRFQTYTFSRLSPMLQVPVEVIGEPEKMKVKGLLDSYYKEHSFYQTENLFFGDYLIMRDANGEIMLGVHVAKEDWLIHSLGGKYGKLMLNILGSIPVLKKLINKRFSFLSLDYLYVAQGSEASITPFLNSVLYVYKKNVAMMALDQEGSLAQLMKKISLGPISVFNKPVEVSIIIKQNPNNGVKLQQWKEKPAFISTLDLV